MEVQDCVDINGNEIANIRFDEDGAIWGVLITAGDEASDAKLSYDCCVANGGTFDPIDAKCYWSTSCSTTETYKIILDPEGDNGVLFQVDEEQVGDCILEVELDFLLKIDCANVTDSLKNIVENLQLELSLEKVIYDETLPIPNNLESVYKRPMILAPDIVTYLDGNTNTGLTLAGVGCDPLIQNLITDLGPTDSQVINTSSFASTWVRYKMVIDDLSVLEKIYNEYLKVVIITNDLSNFSLLIDNIKLTRICTSETGEVYLKDECPSFDLRRIIDNKKSWVYNDETENRDFDLSRRETNYNINDDRLGINTKEIDLLIKPSVAIENDVFTFILNNPCLLDPSTGCTINGDAINGGCVDITALLTTELSAMTSGEELYAELINVRNVKTLNGYPTIDLVYYRYINSYEHCGVVSDSLSNESLNEFVKLIGSFWSDLIEQVVPATTIWGSSYQYSNSVFNTASNNLVYKKSSLIFDGGTYEAPSPTNASNSAVDVITVDVTDTDYFGPIEFAPPNSTQEYTGVSIVQINDGSEFIGTVTVIGGGIEGELTGNTITINETILDSCDTYNNDCN